MRTINPGNSLRLLLCTILVCRVLVKQNQDQEDGTPIKDIAQYIIAYC